MSRIDIGSKNRGMKKLVTIVSIFLFLVLGGFCVVYLNDRKKASKLDNQGDQNEAPSVTEEKPLSPEPSNEPEEDETIIYLRKAGIALTSFFPKELSSDISFPSYISQYLDVDILYTSTSLYLDTTGKVKRDYQDNQATISITLSLEDKSIDLEYTFIILGYSKGEQKLMLFQMATDLFSHVGANEIVELPSTEEACWSMEIQTIYEQTETGDCIEYRGSDVKIVDGKIEIGNITTNQKFLVNLAFMSKESSEIENRNIILNIFVND